jgi:hypothetical protein
MLVFFVNLKSEYTNLNTQPAIVKVQTKRLISQKLFENDLCMHVYMGV